MTFLNLYIDVSDPSRCESERKTEIEMHGYHQERYQEEWTDGRQHSRPQGLEIGSFQGDPLTWKSLQGEK